LNRFWLAAGAANTLLGAVVAVSVVPHFTSDSQLQMWLLAVAPIGVINLVAALQKNRRWAVVLPLNLLALPGWGAVGLFGFQSLWAGLGAASVPLTLSSLAFAWEVRRKMRDSAPR
jgi:hypothetical protein